jgi:hypothetical protein
MKIISHLSGRLFLAGTVFAACLAVPAEAHFRGRVVKQLPQNHQVVVVDQATYFYHNGAFYSPGPVTGYVVTAPPVGAIVARIPAPHMELTAGGRTYFYYDGAFYRFKKKKNAYVVVEPPRGAVVESLPPGLTSLTVEGERRYIYAGVHSMRETRDGKPVLVVLGAG